MLGRNSANMATGEILGYHQRVDNQGYRHVNVRIRVLERLKGAADWKVGETQLISFGGWGGSKEMRIVPGYACPILLLNETNLSLVRRGIAQDFTANDKAE